MGGTFYKEPVLEPEDVNVETSDNTDDTLLIDSVQNEEDIDPRSIEE